MSELTQHVASRTHKDHIKLFESRPERQILLSESINLGERNSFAKDLSEAILAAGIPWVKIENYRVKSFLQKYTGKIVPDESTLRKNYLPLHYIAVILNYISINFGNVIKLNICNCLTQALDRIREDIGSNPVWISIDETTDVNGRFIANVLVGALRKDQSSLPHIVASKELPVTNNATITQLVLDSMRMFSSTNQCHQSL